MIRPVENITHYIVRGQDFAKDLSEFISREPQVDDLIKHMAERLCDALRSAIKPEGEAFIGALEHQIESQNNALRRLPCSFARMNAKTVGMLDIAVGMAKKIVNDLPESRLHIRTSRRYGMRGLARPYTT